ncbi:TPA: hypothetical protein N0F65_006856 [Lagenidium giganteum]|uniref:Homeobox domain-containing protein n=1 Tax=Lagenidium giganteum TaxID=4803 RepID=A0AAV2YK77_9STRA|nr:TPA: hypothetical protein N0F65_006856 [Lagenidium giganteum]
MCPETSPTEKKASKMDSNASSPVASSSTKHSSQQNHKHTHSSVSASSLKNRKKGTRRGTLNPEAKNVLKAWMFSPEHFAHPYPSEEEKEELACEAGIEVKQLSNWFTNARKRLWQPVLRQSGVEVKNFLSTGRGGPRGNKLDVPPNLQHLVAPKDSPPQSPMRVSDADEALNSPLKRPWSELQQSTSPAVSSTTEEASQPSKKKKSSSSRKRHKEERKQPTAGTAALTKTATQLSQELRLALAEKQASAASSPLASPPRSSSSSASTFQDLEILAATSLLGLHQQYQTAH